MSGARLKSGLWVGAALRFLAGEGICATLLRRGDEDAGALVIKQNFLDGGFRVLCRLVTASGGTAWHGATGSVPVDESRADAYIAREIGRDRDLWVIEIEDRRGRLPFGEPIGE